MVKEATTVVPYPELGKIGLEGPMVEWRDKGAESLQIAQCSGSKGVGLLRVAKSLSEEKFESHEAIYHVEEVANRRAHHEYVVILQVDEFRGLVDECFDEVFITKDIYFEKRGLNVTLIAGQGVLERGGKLADTLFDGGIDCEVESVREYGGSTRPVDVLTERQREALRTAHELGYFEVPREVTSDEIADELGVNNSTALEIVRRAESNLAAEIFGSRSKSTIEH